jgi:hypothetical protein
MVQRRGRTRLALEALDGVRVGLEPLRQRLDRDDAVEPRVVRAVDLAHPSGTERHLYGIGAQSCPRC